MTKILDCTIRDGGHLNGWNFDEDCVRSVYAAALKTGVDFFEIGYRNKFSGCNFGKFYRCEDDFLFSLLELNENCKLSVMIDTGKSDLNDFKICRSDLTPISHVRVSTYAEKLDEALALCEGLLEKNYNVFLNLMAISNFHDKDFKKLEKNCCKNALESVYFADSFGTLYPDDIEKFYKILSGMGIEKISFHSHNNLQLAFANTLKAFELDFYSVDATTFGMGRGAGNLPMELLLGYLAKEKNDKYNPIFYMEIIEKYFQDFYKKTPWGYSLPHLIGGLKNIHPNNKKEIEKYIISKN